MSDRRLPPPRAPLRWDLWPLAAESFSRPWEPELRVADLAWWAEAVEAGVEPRLPGRDALAARWGVVPNVARDALAAFRSRPPAVPRAEAEYSRGSASVRQDDARTTPDGERTKADRSAETASLAPASRQVSEGRGRPEPGAERIRRDKQPGSANPGGSGCSSSSSSKTKEIDLEIEEGSERRPLPPEVLAGLEDATKDFVRLFDRWRADPNAPERWVESSADAERFFRDVILAIEGIADVDLPRELAGFDRWLGAKAAERRGERTATSTARFPKNWKKTLLGWMRRAVEHAARRKPAEEPRRRRVAVAASEGFAAFKPVGDEGAFDDF